MKPIWTIRIAAVAPLFCIAAAAYGQYVWLDDKGIKQFSDMPPPASVPQNRILKQPGHAYSAPQSSSSDTDSSSQNTAAPTKSSTPMTLAEKNAEFLKRRAEQEKQQAKAAEEAKNAVIKARNCDNARSYYRSLTSGERIASTDKNGERYYLSDEQRAQETKEVQNALNDCK
jgi:glucan-binding YG repeat protein